MMVTLGAKVVNMARELCCMYFLKHAAGTCPRVLGGLCLNPFASSGTQ